MYLILNPYKEILAGIHTALAVNEGIIKLTGQRGVGKTALCDQLCGELKARGHAVVFWRQPPASVNDLQQSLLRQLRLNTARNFIRQLTFHLQARGAQARPLILIFDDAHEMDDTTFASIRMLCSIQSGRRGLIRILISGSEALDVRLAAWSFRALAQFLSQSFVLPALSGEQVREFCELYRQHCSLPDAPLSAAQLRALYRETKGLPPGLLKKLRKETLGALTPGLARHDDPATGTAMMARGPASRKQWTTPVIVLVMMTLAGIVAYRWSASG